MNLDIEKDRYFARNATGVSLVEFIWGLGFPILLESTFLQIFLKTLGASDFAIGLVPCIFITGISTFPILSSYLTRNHKYKRTIVLNLHIMSSIAIILFGISMFFVKTPSYILTLFFLSYIVFSLSIGLTLPVWLNFLVKIFSGKKSVSGFGIMMCSQHLAKLISSFAVLKFVEQYGFSTTSAAYIFLVSGLLFLTGSFCFLLTKEISTDEKLLKNHESFAKHTKSTIKEIFENKNFLKYLVGDLDNYVVITMISFYAVYATEFFNIKASTAAGLFVAFYYAGSIIASLLSGPLDFTEFMDLKKKFLSTKIITIAALLLLIFYPVLNGFLAASLLFGLCRGIRSNIFSPSVKMFADKEDATGYFALAPMITIVFGSGYPLLCGLMLDSFESFQADAYRLMFGVSIVLTLIFFYFGIITDFNKKTD